MSKQYDLEYQRKDTRKFAVSIFIAAIVSFLGWGLNIVFYILLAVLGYLIWYWISMPKRIIKWKALDEKYLGKNSEQENG